MSAQAGRSGGVNEASVDSMAQDDDFREVKRRKSRYSDDTSQTARRSIISVQKNRHRQAAYKNSDNSQILCTSKYMDTEAVGAEKALPEEAPRKSGRPPPIVMASTRNLIRLQRDLKTCQKRVRVSE
jgi:hypothetical protein